MTLLSQTQSQSYGPSEQEAILGAMDKPQKAEFLREKEGNFWGDDLSRLKPMFVYYNCVIFCECFLWNSFMLYK